ncbi:XdhC and CoxI family protein [mine drainage metagenome]|uniref:XdhC and CoxI family protein n=1 Tax=mine drainage metagenome TaxID=410659 RepID=A0A1J5RS77_9ZZZZ
MSNFENIIERSRVLESQEQPYALATVIRIIHPTSANVGDKALVTSDGKIYGWIGGGCAQPLVVRMAKLCLEDGKPRHIRITPDPRGEKAVEDVLEFGMPCQSGGTIELFIDPVTIKPGLVVLGESPVAFALARIAPHVGFRVTWLTDNEIETPDVRIIPAARSIEISPGAYVVVATQGINDMTQLKLALSLRARHVAFVASQRKAEKLRITLLESGADSAAVEAIEAPAGIPIHAKSSQEIALSILASLVSRVRSTELEQNVQEEASKEAAIAETATT